MADPDRRASLRPEIQPRSILKLPSVQFSPFDCLHGDDAGRFRARETRLRISDSRSVVIAGDSIARIDTPCGAAPRRSAFLLARSVTMRE